MAKIESPSMLHPPSEAPRVSVIITSCSNEHFNYIIESLEVLNKSSYSNFEIIILIDANKALFNRLRNYLNSNNYQHIQVVFIDKILGLSGARNLGVKMSRGDIVAFIDDDATPSIDWIKEIVGTFKLDPSIAGVTGPAIPLQEKDVSIDWIPVELQWIIGGTTWYQGNIMHDVRHAWGMNMAFRRDIFVKCHGFSTIHGLKKGGREGVDRFPHEDVEFCLRLKKETGKRIVYNPNVKVFHRVRRRKLTIRFFVKHAYVQGFAKRMLRDLASKYEKYKSNALLSQEYALLWRILHVLMPKTLRDVFRKPSLALHKLFIIITALAFLAIGYYSPFYYLKLRKYV